jgi:hypothetical protein
MRSIIGDRRVTSWLRIAGYVAIIISIVVFAIWAYLRHHRTEKPEPGPLTKKERPPLVLITWDNRFTFADDKEFFAPPAFPWSMSSIGQAPRVEVMFVTILSVPEAGEIVESETEVIYENSEPVISDNGTEITAMTTDQIGYLDIIRNAMLKRTPSLAMPYEIDATPPYLVVPLEFTLDFVLGPDGEVKSAMVQGNMDETLRVQIAEKAVNLRVPSVLSWYDFRCGMRFIPRHYDKIIGTRDGNRLPESEYKLLLRGLQYGTSAFTESVLENAPELLSGEDEYTIKFTINGDGYPVDTVIKPFIVEPAAETAVTEAVSSTNFPGTLGGANVEIILGSD